MSSHGGTEHGGRAPPLGRSTFPYFACTPDGYRLDCPGGEPGVSKFRLWVRQPAELSGRGAQGGEGGVAIWAGGTTSRGGSDEGGCG